MSSLVKKYGPWALVTGASSGIGDAFARLLAQHGFNLVLAARRRDRLEALAAELKKAHGIDARPAVCDLSQPDFIDALAPVIEGLEIGLLINNAGFGTTGALVDNALQRELDLLDVNCRAPLVLAHALGGPMRQRGKGGIVFVSSVLGFRPAPFLANYAASKAYTLYLGEALYEEMAPYGVDVLAVCPGGTRTEFFKEEDAQTFRNLMRLSAPILLDPADVPQKAMDDLGKTGSSVVGLANELTVFSNRFVPRGLGTKLLGSVIGAFQPKN